MCTELTDKQKQIIETVEKRKERMKDIFKMWFNTEPDTIEVELHDDYKLKVAARKFISPKDPDEAKRFSKIVLGAIDGSSDRHPFDMYVSYGHIMFEHTVDSTTFWVDIAPPGCQCPDNPA